MNPQMQACSDAIDQMVKGQLHALASNVLDTIRIGAYPIAKQHNIAISLGIFNLFCKNVYDQERNIRLTNLIYTFKIKIPFSNDNHTNH